MGKIPAALDLKGSIPDYFLFDGNLLDIHEGAGRGVNGVGVRGSEFGLGFVLVRVGLTIRDLVWGSGRGWGCCCAKNCARISFNGGVGYTNV